jgi:hypothetical protein
LKKILFISVLLLNFVGFAQEPISKNPPVQYSTKPFGSKAEEGDKKDILKVIDIFMTAVNSKDKSIFDSVSYKGIQRIVTLVDQDKVTTTVYDNDTLLVGLKDIEDGFRERYWDAVVLTDGNIASVWAPYDFFSNGKFSHCGVDLFYLVKENKEWTIAHFGYTRNKLCN